MKITWPKLISCEHIKNKCRMATHPLIMTQALFQFSECHLIFLKETHFTWPPGSGRTCCVLFFSPLSTSVFCFFVFNLSERRLADAQAGMLCHVHFWAEVESLWDCEANGKDSRQTGERNARLGSIFIFFSPRGRRHGEGSQENENLTYSNCPCRGCFLPLSCV